MATPRGVPRGTKRQRSPGGDKPTSLPITPEPKRKK
jgi:hypothetical protein